MSKSKLFSIITIACFVSILCIPIGIVLMLYYTNWKKKTKIILSLALTAFYAGLIAFFFLFKPSYNTSGTTLPFGSNSGYTAFNSDSSSTGNTQKKERVPKKVKEGQKKVSSSVIYPILFFLFMLFLIFLQNLRSKGKSKYENPYVDTTKYKLPLPPDAKLPMVHFLHLELNEGEKIYFATETNQAGNEGNLVITNQRVAILTKSQNEEIALQAIKAVSATTNTVMCITTEEQKSYIFMPENQMKYAIAVLNWAAGVRK